MLDIIILAAGKGTRMRSELPKVLHPLAGKPLAQHVIDRARDFANARIHLVVGHGAEVVQARLAGPDMQFTQQLQQLGTGHAVQQVLPKLPAEGVVLIMYGDVPLIQTDTLQQLVAAVTPEAMALLTVDLQNPTGYGRIIRNASGHVVAIVEQKDATAAQLAITEGNSGVMSMQASHLHRWLPQLQNANAQGEYYLTDVIALAVADGVAIHAVKAASEQEVLGINNRSQQAQLERAFQWQQAQALMDAGVTLLDPHRFDLRGRLVAGQDCIIDVNAIFEGEVVLGNGVEIGPNCVIKNCVIGDGVHIYANCHLENARVETGCSLGPYARLRPGSHLKPHAKVGNFVEIKQAVLGEGSKVNHLSYIGDATLGADVNVGAGTITCNYDGVNKHKTEIGDKCFVGANSTLVAPVSLANGVTVAAGSTITRPVAEDELVVARSRQRHIQGWQRPTKKG